MSIEEAHSFVFQLQAQGESVHVSAYHACCPEKAQLACTEYAYIYRPNLIERLLGITFDDKIDRAKRVLLAKSRRRFRHEYEANLVVSKRVAQ